MATRLDVLPEAVDEAIAAARWYTERDLRVAAAFEEELARALKEIARAPETWSRHHHATHRFLLHRFSYAVVYKIYSNVVVIVAVAHGKRRPGYWRHR